MPNTREKLIELLSHVQYLGGLEEKIADHLIANGVTVTDTNVGKWIPVTERLPEKHDRYLVLTPSPFGHKAYTPWLAWYEPEVGFFDSDPEYGDLEMDDVTHWMPLPEPPKGE